MTKDLKLSHSNPNHSVYCISVAILDVVLRIA